MPGDHRALGQKGPNSIEVLPHEWKISDKEVYRHPLVVIVPHKNLVRIPARHEWKADDQLILNHIYLGAPTRIAPSGTARYENVSTEDIETILDREREFVAEGPPAWSMELTSAEWINHNFWEAKVLVTTLDDEKNGIKILLSRSDDSNPPAHNHVTSLAEGGTKQGTKRLKVSADVESLVVAFRLMSHDYKQGHGSKTLSIWRPDELDRPEKEEYTTGSRDWWDERKAETEPEKPAVDFDVKYADQYSEVFYRKPVAREAYWYRANVTVDDPTANTTPGGINVTYGFRKPLVLENLSWPEQARVWMRPTKLRGSGAAWFASVNSRHCKPEISNPVTIPVPQSLCPPGDLLDVMVQGYLGPYPLTPSRVVTVETGPIVPYTAGTPMLSMSMFAWRRFPSFNPPEKDYSPLENAFAELPSVPADKENWIKARVLQEGKILSNQETKEAFKKVLPKFIFLSDNFGLCNALPEDVWDQIIEETDTESLNYDPLWYSCADFATDFKAAAARLGAKVAVIFDFGGQHAYCALPVLNPDGSVRIEFFEPQTDDEVIPGKGLYKQGKNGWIMLW